MSYEPAPNPRDPFLKFYPQSWFGDTALRGCSMSAQGLWANLLLLMHQEGEPYGHLAKKGTPWEDAAVAKLFGLTVTAYRVLIRELEEAGVPSRTVTGILYSRKLIRDEARKVKARINGSLGGNPTILRKERRSHKREVNPLPYPTTQPTGLSTSTKKEQLPEIQSEQPPVVESAESAERRRVVLESWKAA